MAERAAAAKRVGSNWLYVRVHLALERAELCRIERDVDGATAALGEARRILRGVSQSGRGASILRRHLAMAVAELDRDRGAPNLAQVFEGLCGKYAHSGLLYSAACAAVSSWLSEPDPRPPPERLVSFVRARGYVAEHERLVSRDTSTYPISFA